MRAISEWAAKAISQLHPQLGPLDRASGLIG